MRAHCLRVAVIAAVFTAGCAAVNRDTFVRERTAEHVYDEPLEVLWPKVQSFMTEQGLAYRQQPGEYVLETDWVEAMAGSHVAGSWHRYLVQGVPLADNRAQLRVIKQSKTAAEDPRLAAAARTGELSGDPTEAAATDEGNVDPSTSPSDMRYQAQQSEVGELRRHSDSAKRGDRDFALELLLIKSLDPSAAQEIEQAADAKFQ